jgi:hypothetical protein
MTSIVFMVAAFVASVGVIKWVLELITAVREKFAPGIRTIGYRGLSPVDWSLILMAVEFIAAAVIGVVGGIDVWSGWAFFLTFLGLIELSFKEIARWVAIVVAWIKKHNPLGR